MRKISCLTFVVLLGLVGCEQVSTNSADVVTPEPATIPDVVDPTPEVCAGGVEVAPLRISGASWNNGVGVKTASILLEKGTLENLQRFASGQFDGEDMPRKIKSSRTTGNGRQIIIFSGEVISNADQVTTICLKTN